MSQRKPRIIILKLLSRGDMYGYQIVQQMSLLSDKAFEMSQGSLYPFLHRLEREGCLTSYSVPENGRERLYYHLTEKGQAALADKEARWEHYVQAMGSILKGCDA